MRSENILFDENHIYNPADSLDMFYFIIFLTKSAPYEITKNIHSVFKTMDGKNNEIFDSIDMVFSNVRIDNRFNLLDFEAIFPPIIFYQFPIKYCNSFAIKRQEIYKKNSIGDNTNANTKKIVNISNLFNVTNRKRSKKT